MTKLKERIMLSGKFYMVGVFCILGLLLLCFTAIEISGANSTAFLAIAAPMATSLLALLVISKQVDDVKADQRTQNATLDRVEQQTNGALTEKFDEIKSHIDDAVEGK